MHSGQNTVIVISTTPLPSHQTQTLPMILPVLSQAAHGADSKTLMRPLPWHSWQSGTIVDSVTRGSISRGNEFHQSARRQFTTGAVSVELTGRRFEWNWRGLNSRHYAPDRKKRQDGLEKLRQPFAAIGRMNPAERCIALIRLMAEIDQQISAAEDLAFAPELTRDERSFAVAQLEYRRTVVERVEKMLVNIGEPRQ